MKLVGYHNCFCSTAAVTVNAVCDCAPPPSSPPPSYRPLRCPRNVERTQGQMDFRGRGQTAFLLRLLSRFSLLLLCRRSYCLGWVVVNLNRLRPAASANRLASTQTELLSNASNNVTCRKLATILN